MSLVLTALNGFPMVMPGDDIAWLIRQRVKSNQLTIHNGDILVVAQKIISKAENRLIDLSTVKPGNHAQRIAKEAEKDPRLVELILQESREVLRVRPGTIIVEHRMGFVCANAGIDHSNVRGEGGKPEDWVLLLPCDPDASARRIRGELSRHWGKEVGVTIIDSHGRAWRNGIVGMTIGLSGVPGVVDLRGMPDLYQYRLRITQVGAADELAAAASLLMGQANEGTPVIHVRGFPYPLRESNLQELIRDKGKDMFR